MIESTTLLAVGIAYLVSCFCVATAADRGLIPPSVSNSPLVYSLSLCVYSSVWGYYGLVGFAGTEGYAYLATDLGACLACLLVPVLWTPMLRLVRRYRLSSLADVFAFRYKSGAAGVAVTLLLLVATLPYVAQQIQGFTESVRQLAGGRHLYVVAFSFCAALTAFAILFGNRHPTTGERHLGIIVAIAFGSVLKIVALLVVTAVAVHTAFPGAHGLHDWVATHPEATRELVNPVREGKFGTLVVLALIAAFLLPRQHHMAFNEAPEDGERALSTASWLFPLLLLLMTFPVPLLLWAGRQLTPAARPDFYVLAIPSARSGWGLTLLAFLGGVSAASGMVLVTTLNLGTMALNHLVLPFRRPSPTRDLYGFVQRSRRALTTAIIAASYGVFVLLSQMKGRLVDFGGNVSFIGVAQLAPGLIGALFWKRATARGLLAGLGAGTATWLGVSVLALFARSGAVPAGLEAASVLGIRPRDAQGFELFSSLTVNAFLFVYASLAKPPTVAEEEGANACIEFQEVPLRGSTAAASAAEIRAGLARVVGRDPATAEVQQALADLGLSFEETRPAQLLLIRQRLERSLASLLGPTLARAIIEQGVGLRNAGAALATGMRDLETRLAASNARLHGISAELDEARRYLRDVLEHLPVGVCALGSNGEVVIWNGKLAEISGLSTDFAVARSLRDLGEPWTNLLERTASTGGEQRIVVRLKKADGTRIVSVGGGARKECAVLVIEDLTERHALEAQLAHSERLSWLGRLVADAAHHFRNPLTGIMSIAQNLAAELPVGDSRRRVAQILEQAFRIETIVSSLTTFSHPGASAVGVDGGRYSVRTVVEDAVTLARLRHSKRSDDLRVRCSEDLWLPGDRLKMEQAIVNLIDNACDASEMGQPIEVDVSARDAVVRLEIRDIGCGIPAELRARVFEPFFTTKEPGRGTGLGLNLASKIVRDHGGTLALVPRTGRGTVATLCLPVTTKQVPS